MNNSPVLLFDGYCNLCVSSVQFVLKHEKRPVIRFASLQSDFGKKIKEKHGVLENIDSLILFENDQVYYYSDAVLKLCGHLGGLWPVFKIAYIIPKFIRNAMYKYIAKNRYHWFGEKEVCWLPDPKWDKRFIL